MYFLYLHVRKCQRLNLVDVKNWMQTKSTKKENDNNAIWGQFYQWRKAQMRQNAFFGAIQFHQQNYTQLCRFTQLEFMLNYYSVCYMLWASKIGINQLAQNVGEIDPWIPYRVPPSMTHPIHTWRWY